MGPLFIHLGGSLLTRHQFWPVTSKAFASLGLVRVKFGTHSIQIGVTSMVTALGYSEDNVRGLGRWCSQAFQTYMCPLQL